MPADPIDLSTLAEVRAALNIAFADTGRDNFIQTLITTASSHLIDTYQREFATASPVPAARLFSYRGGGILDLAPYNARVGSITLIRLDTDGSSPATLAEFNDWQSAPLPSPWGVIDYLRTPTLFPYPRYTLSDPGHQTWRRVEITATWGYATIPLPVSQACLLTVMDWYRRDSSRPSGFADIDDPDNPGGDVAIPQRARWLMRGFENRSIFA